MSRFRVGVLVALAYASAVRADQETQGQEDSAAARYEALVAEYEEVRRPQTFAPRFFALADEYPKDAVAVDALAWVAKHLRYRPEAARALRRLETNHLDNQRLASVCELIASTASPSAESLLRAALQKSPHENVRAQACFHLIGLLRQQVSLAEQLRQDPGLKRRLQQYYGKPFTEHLGSLDVKTVHKRQENLYERMIHSFGTVETVDGPMRRVAENALFAMRQLSIGQVAPEITGEDIDGRPFKLSDYRGKIVMLSFWGHW